MNGKVVDAASEVRCIAAGLGECLVGLLGADQPLEDLLHSMLGDEHGSICRQRETQCGRLLAISSASL